MKERGDEVNGLSDLMCTCVKNQKVKVVEISLAKLTSIAACYANIGFNLNYGKLVFLSFLSFSPFSA